MASTMTVFLTCVTVLVLAEELTSTSNLTSTTASTPVPAPVPATSTSPPQYTPEDKEVVDDEGHEIDGRGLLYRVKHLKSTRVVTVKETITKYLTCTASKPAYLPYCREHRALLAKLHRTEAPVETLKQEAPGLLQPSVPHRGAAAGRFLAKVHHTHMETYTDTHIHTHTDYRSTVTLIYRGCVPHDAPKVPECPEPKQQAGPFKPCLGLCEGHCSGLCDGNCFGSCEEVAARARACSGSACSVVQRIARQLQAPCLGMCFGHCDGVCDGLCDSTCLTIPE